MKGKYEGIFIAFIVHCLGFIVTVTCDCGNPCLSSCTVGDLAGDPSDCAMYFQCDAGGTWVSKNCTTTGLVFDTAACVCNYRDQSVCQGPCLSNSTDHSDFTERTTELTADNVTETTTLPCTTQTDDVTTTTLPSTTQTDDVTTTTLPSTTQTDDFTTTLSSTTQTDDVTTTTLLSTTQTDDVTTTALLSTTQRDELTTRTETTNVVLRTSEETSSIVTGALGSSEANTIISTTQIENMTIGGGDQGGQSPWEPWFIAVVSLSAVLALAIVITLVQLSCTFCCRESKYNTGRVF